MCVPQCSIINCNQSGEFYMSKSFKTSATKLLASTIFTSSLIYAAPVIAQDDDEAKSRYALDEIVVTARRVEESLQDAPLALSLIHI